MILAIVGQVLSLMLTVSTFMDRIYFVDIHIHDMNDTDVRDSDSCLCSLDTK